MEATVLFRDFEERDIDFIYQCKNDAKLNSLTVGQWHPFTREEAKKWVYGCMGEHETYKFWAICTNNEEKRIVGWASISNIDKFNKSAFWHSIVIGDSQYQIGFPWIETQIFCVTYAFDVLGVNSLSESHFADHPTSKTIGPVLFFDFDRIEKNAVEKNGIIHDIEYYTLNRNVYEEHKAKGDYEFMSVLNRYAQIKRKKKK